MLDNRTAKEHMKGRLTIKTMENVFQRDMVEGFGLSPFNARGVLNQVKEIYIPHLWGKERPVGVGQARILAVSKDEPAGKPLRECQMVPVIVTVSIPEEDEEVRIKYGQAQYRRMKILRMLEEACEQSAYLTEEDLAGIMNMSLRTVKRDISALRTEGYYLPLRGQQKDIGPTISHKSQAVERYIRNEPVSKIAQCIRHSPEAVVRYIKSFARVLVAEDRGLNLDETSFMLGMTKRLVKEYVELGKKYTGEEYTERIKDIISFVKETTHIKLKKTNQLLV